MPFARDYYFGRFKPAELARLQEAYVKTCEAMGRCPITTPYKDEMAREIVQIYECGVVQPDRIAELMLQIESVKPRPVADRFREAVPNTPAKTA